MCMFLTESHFREAFGGLKTRVSSNDFFFVFFLIIAIFNFVNKSVGFHTKKVGLKWTVHGYQLMFKL